MGRAVCFVASVIVFTPIPVLAQTNSWINPTGGKWEDASSWSLGIPPGAGQAVFVANHGWKAVSIDNTTAANSPQTMSIGSLWIMSPGTDTVNTVLMNYAGLQTPLNANDIEVSNSTSMVILQSAVQSGYFGVWNGGMVTEDVSSRVSLSNLLSVSGTYYLTNGTLTVTPANGSGEAVDGQFIQAGGSNFCGGLLVFGVYDLSGGQLVLPPPGNSVEGLQDFGHFVQSGGSVHSTVIVGVSGNGGGNYQLHGGLLSADYLAVPANPDTGTDTTPDASYMGQTGGTNVAGFMDVGQEYGFGNPSFGLGTYSLTNGLLVSGTLRINGQGNFYQYGGVHSNSSMSLSQTELSAFTNYFVPAHYYLYGGTFTSSSVNGQSSVFAQTGGMAQVAALGMAGGQYSLTGGQLNISNMVLSGGANFLQSGGTVMQTGTLQLADVGLTLGPGAQQLGQLSLYVANATSVLTFSPGSTVLHFANSSSQAWSSGSILIISNWNGSLSGGGADQVFFGGDSTGLTAQQLSQVQFVNPAGLPNGTYSAQILSDGEVVPGQGSSTSGPVNSWISATSGNWQDAASWSLGVLPGAGQTILITNAGWKAVAINPTTAQNYPDSLKIAALTVSSPGTNTVNTLLLNFAGLGSPLVIGGGTNLGHLIVTSNAAVTVLSSALQLNNSGAPSNGVFSIGGTFTESDTSQVTAQEMTLGDIGPGIFNLTNSLLQVNTENIAAAGQFTQDGGSNSAAVIHLRGGHYDLQNGGLSGTIDFTGPGFFQQHNGVVNGDVHVSNSGTYEQDSGTLNGEITMLASLGSGTGTYILKGGTHMGAMDVPGGELEAGFIIQTGGTNTGSIGLGALGATPGLIGPGTYTLSNGVLEAASISEMAGCTTKIYGGKAIVSDLALNGTQDRFGDYGNSDFELNGGLLSAQTISMPAADFHQSGGTNQVGTVSMGHQNAISTYTLSGGALLGSNFTCNGTFQTFPSFSQSGGLHTETNLSFTYSVYTLSGGQLSVSNLQLTASTFHHTGGVFTPPSFVEFVAATWDEKTSGAQFGPLQLSYAVGATNSNLLLPSTACTVRFANSSSVAWSAPAKLIIEHWNGSQSGGGLHQLFFGTSASGLTSQQLSLVQFSNPAGLPNGTYSARILSDGEVVPNQAIGTSVTFSKQGNNLVLTWPSGWTLQSATNVAGPYSNVSGATSPYTNNMALDPQRFFRLSQ
jgi:hypothetical protein